MLSNKFFPYSSMQEINLDWILTKIKNILRFVPDDGAVGQILRRTAHGAEWSDEQGAGGSVTSVNGMQGAVVLTASDVGALPDTYVAPVDSVNGQTGTVVLSIPSDTADLTNTAGFVDAADAAAAAPVQSVNSQTGVVVLSIPSDTADLTNTAGFVDAAGAAAAAPVQSVNGKTGAVVVGTTDTLFSGSLTLNQSAALLHSIFDYDILILQWKVSGNGQIKSCVMIPAVMSAGESNIDSVFATTQYYNCLYYVFETATSLKLTAEFHGGWNAPAIIGVIGIKF